MLVKVPFLFLRVKLFVEENIAVVVALARLLPYAADSFAVGGSSAFSPSAHDGQSYQQYRNAAHDKQVAFLKAEPVPRYPHQHSA